MRNAANAKARLWGMAGLQFHNKDCRLALSAYRTVAVSAVRLFVGYIVGIQCVVAQPTEQSFQGGLPCFDLCLQGFQQPASKGLQLTGFDAILDKISS